MAGEGVTSFTTGSGRVAKSPRTCRGTLCCKSVSKAWTAKCPRKGKWHIAPPGKAYPAGEPHSCLDENLSRAGSTKGGADEQSTCQKPSLSSTRCRPSRQSPPRARPAQDIRLVKSYLFKAKLSEAVNLLPHVLSSLPGLLPCSWEGSQNRPATQPLPARTCAV